MQYLQLEIHQGGLMVNWTQQKKEPINVKMNRNGLNWNRRWKKNGEKNSIYDMKDNYKWSNSCNWNPWRRRKRKWGRINISRENGWKLLKINDKSQPTTWKNTKKATLWDIIVKLLNNRELEQILKAVKG